MGSDSGERSSRIQVGTSDSQRLDAKNQQEIIHWHTRYVSSLQHLSCSVLDIVWLTLFVKSWWFVILFLRGVAARALHLSRGVEKPSGRVTYIVVLEGLCRFSVQELSTRGTYYTARISPLEMTKPGKLLVMFSLVQVCWWKYIHGGILWFIGWPTRDERF